MTRVRRPRGTTAQDELREMTQRLRFRIVGGSFTGLGFVSLGIFLLRQRLHPASPNPSWLAELGLTWLAPLGFGIVVWIHAFDVWRDRRTIFRILAHMEAKERRTAP